MLDNRFRRAVVGCVMTAAPPATRAVVARRELDLDPFGVRPLVHHSYQSTRRGPSQIA
jgi:hypothetical protein